MPCTTGAIGLHEIDRVFASCWIMDDLRRVLQQEQLSSIVEQQDIVLLEHNQSVSDALQLLAEHNILSAPIVVSPGLEDVESLSPTESTPQLMGWCDVKDIIKAFLAFLHEHHKQLPTSMLALMTELEKQGPRFGAKMLITVLGNEDRGLVYQTDAQASVLSAIRDVFLGQPGGGRVVHRLAIFDAHGDITHIVSQMDVLRFLLKHQEYLGPAASQDIQILGLVKPEKTRQMVVLEPHTPTLLAYEKMATAGVTGAPVVSAAGELIANLSISDIRGIQPDHFGVLALPVAEFLAVKHGTSYLGYSQQSSSGAEHPFFATRPHPTRPTGTDAGDAGSAAAHAASPWAAAMAAPVRTSSMTSTGSRSDAKKPKHSHHRSKDPGQSEDIPLITCSSKSTLLEVLQLMCDNNVHRVYVHEKGATPQEGVGVITPTDILTLTAGVGGLMSQGSDAAAPAPRSKTDAPAGASAEQGVDKQQRGGQQQKDLCEKKRSRSAVDGEAQ